MWKSNPGRRGRAQGLALLIPLVAAGAAAEAWIPNDRSSRFVVLQGGAMVLDKETQLIWDRTPRTDDTTSWDTAQRVCERDPVGDRFGFRLPT